MIIARLLPRATMKQLSKTILLLAVSIGLAGCMNFADEPPVEVAKPDEMPAPDAVPAGTVIAEAIDQLPGTQSERDPAGPAKQPNRSVLATSRPAPARPIRPSDLVALTGSEIGRMMVGTYYRQTGGRVLYLRPNGQAVIAREGGEPSVQIWNITDNDLLCLTRTTVRSCQQVYRVGQDLLLTAEDGNQRRYQRLSQPPAWL